MQNRLRTRRTNTIFAVQLGNCYISFNNKVKE